jgi:hypothetical protein
LARSEGAWLNHAASTLVVVAHRDDFVTFFGCALQTYFAVRLFKFMNEEIKDAQLDEDYHTKVRYLSWLKKVDDKWEPQRAVLRAGETHPLLDKSLAEHSRLT